MYACHQAQVAVQLYACHQAQVAVQSRDHEPVLAWSRYIEGSRTKASSNPAF